MCMCLHPRHTLAQTDSAPQKGQDFVKKCGMCQRKRHGHGNYIWLLFKGSGVDVEVML